MDAHAAMNSRGFPANPLVYELRLSWAFIAGDLSSAVVPPLLFSLVAWKVDGAVWGHLPAVLARSLLYFWLYIYTFCLANQLAGIEEDRTNKPHRPLVTGMVTPEAARLRLYVTMALFLLVGAGLGVLVYAALWLLVIVVHNLANLSRHWVVKNSCMSVGIIVQLGAAWQLITPLTEEAWRWILFPAVVILPLVSLQDLRDMAGRCPGRAVHVPSEIWRAIHASVPRRLLRRAARRHPLRPDAATQRSAAGVDVRCGTDALVAAHRRPGGVAALVHPGSPHLPAAHVLVLRPAGKCTDSPLGSRALGAVMLDSISGPRAVPNPSFALSTRS